MRQRRDRVEREIAPRLEPDFRAYVRQHHGFQAGLDEDVVQFLHPRRLFAVEFADRKAIAFDVVNDAGGSSCSRWIDYAADKAAGIDMLGEHACGIEALQSLIVVLTAE